MIKVIYVCTGLYILSLHTIHVHTATVDSVVLEEGSDTTNETEYVLTEQFIQSGVTVTIVVQARNSSTGEDVCDPVMDSITIPGSEYGFIALFLSRLAFTYSLI